MPSSADKKQVVRIVKKKRGGHGGHHGGSWKVAYADFVTAMMAFFLLMWLVNMAKPEQKQAIATYFKEFSLFDRAGYETGRGKAEQVAGQVPETPPPPRMGHEMKASAADVQAREELRAVLTRGVQAKLGALAGQVIVENFEDGVRIHLVDSAGAPFFEPNRAEPTEAGRRALDAVSACLKNLPQRIAIEGHTDGRGSLSGARSNWDLSSERAQFARRELEDHGVNPARLVRVSGYASATPLISTNIMDPRNRRVSILVYDTGAALPVSTYGIATEAARISGGASGAPATPAPAYGEDLSLKPVSPK